MNINYYKLFLAALGMVCVTVLMAMGSIAAAAGMPIITMIVGYAIGNGIASAQNVTVEPLMQRKNGETQYEVTAPASVHIVEPEAEIDPDRAEFDAWKVSHE